MRHYLFLSREHAIEKYVGRGYDAAELALGWHQARDELRPGDVVLQSRAELRRFSGDDGLEPGEPRRSHPLFDPVADRLFPAVSPRSRRRQ
jgi:hypothetical protein